MRPHSGKSFFAELQGKRTRRGVYCGWKGFCVCVCMGVCVGNTHLHIKAGIIRIGIENKKSNDTAYIYIWITR